MKKLIYLFVAVLLLAVVACAKPPQEAIDSVGRALEDAKGAEASMYASDSLKDAEEAQAALQAELDTQAQKFAMFRSYKKAEELAAAAEAAAKKAEEDAVAGKEAARQEAETLITDAKAAIAQAMEDIKKAPRGKGAQMDIAALKADIAGAETTVAEAEEAYNGGMYLDAKAKADSAKMAAETVSSDVEKAIEMRKAMRR